MDRNETLNMLVDKLGHSEANQRYTEFLNSYSIKHPIEKPNNNYLERRDDVLYRYTRKL